MTTIEETKHTTCDNTAEKVDIQARIVASKLFEKNSNATFLDIGCQFGEKTLELAKLIGTEKVFGVENNEENIKIAESKGLKVINADLNFKLPIDNETYDVIHGAHIIEHIYYTDTFMRELNRILKKNGYLILITPNASAPHNIFPLFLGYQPISGNISNEANLGNLYYKGPYPDGIYMHHLRLFTYHGMKDIAEYHGFKVEYLSSYGQVLLPKFLNDIISKIDKIHGCILITKLRKV